MAKKLESSLVNMFVVLTVITVLSAAALAAMNSATIDPIKKAQQQKTEAAIKMVLPQFASLEEKTVNVDGEELVCNYAYNDSKELVGVAVKSFTNKGFNGYIGVMVGFDDEGTITGYQILETGETPGLGTKADTYLGRNKMKHRYLLTVMVVTMLFSSCTVSTKMVQSSPVVARNVELDPIKADIEVNQDQKLTGEGIAKYILFFRVSNLKDQKMVEGVSYSKDTPFMFNRGRATARAIAAYEALQACPDCDVLVHPKYEVVLRKSPLGIIYRKYTVRVSGYGAKYKNFRTEKELKIIGDQNKEYIVIDDKE